MYYYGSSSPIALISEETATKDDFAQCEFESKNYMYMQFACNLASTYIFNLITH